MNTIPPSPPNQPPAPQPVVVVQKKRGCLGWIGLGVVAFIGLVIVGGILGAIAGSGDNADAPVQAVASSTDGSDGDDGSAEPSDTATPSGPDGSRAQPWPAGSTVDITWDVLGDADESVWTTTIGTVTDVTAQVLAENQFNEQPPEGVVYAGFPVDMTLVSANKEPLSAGFNLSFEIHGAANVYDPNTLDLLGGCGVVPGDFDMFTEVFVGGTVEGLVCIPIPTDELDGATAVINFGGDRIWFGG